MAKNQDQAAAVQTAAAATEPTKMAIPFGKRVRFAVLAKPYLGRAPKSESEPRRRYIGVATYTIGSSPFTCDLTVSATVKVVEGKARVAVEVMMPTTGSSWSRSPVFTAADKAAGEALAHFLRSEGERAVEWLGTLPADERRRLLTGDLSSGESGEAVTGTVDLD